MPERLCSPLPNQATCRHPPSLCASSATVPAIYSFRVGFASTVDGRWGPGRPLSPQAIAAMLTPQGLISVLA
eukprot:7323724-Pyramimonas_sp.AAC.1